MKLSKKVAIAMLLVNAVVADTIDECPIPYEVMYAIAMTERHPARDIGYPYLISFNNKKDLVRMKHHLHDVQILDSRTIDCKSKKQCMKISKTLLRNNITNIDLGAFQINYKYHPASIDTYFSLPKSYRKACLILANIQEKYGWNWASVGKYHSYNPKIGNKYAWRVFYNLNRIKENR